MNGGHLRPRSVNVVEGAAIELSNGFLVLGQVLGKQVIAEAIILERHPSGIVFAIAAELAREGCGLQYSVVLSGFKVSRHQESEGRFYRERKRVGVRVYPLARRG